jgi:hypothetical protein
MFSIKNIRLKVFEPEAAASSETRLKTKNPRRKAKAIPHNFTSDANGRKCNTTHFSYEKKILNYKILGIFFGVVFFVNDGKFIRFKARCQDLFFIFFLFALN